MSPHHLDGDVTHTVVESAFFVGRPNVERACHRLGVLPRLDPLDSGTWLAVLHDLYEDYAYRIQTTGSTPAQAFDRLEKLLADLDRS